MLNEVKKTVNTVKVTPKIAHTQIIVKSKVRFGSVEEKTNKPK
jgi:hypothetical protein